MSIVGAPLPEEQVDFRPMLEGVGEDKVVAVFNPLTQDFNVQFARTLAQPAPLNPEQQFARDRGLILNKTAMPVSHVVQYHILKAGQTENLPGDIAQVAVRQLVTYIIGQRYHRKATKPIADPHVRHQVEMEVIVGPVRSTVDVLNHLSVQEQTKQEIEGLNSPQTVEPVNEKEEAAFNEPKPEPKRRGRKPGTKLTRK